jgi:mycothiol system anti-sigma-R factor
VDLSEISCEEVLAEIEHFLHGELDRGQTVRLADHLDTCPPCFERAEFQRKLKEIVKDKCRSQAPQAPEHLVLRIRQVIHLEKRVDEA